MSRLLQLAGLVIFIVLITILVGHSPGNVNDASMETVPVETHTDAPASVKLGTLARERTEQDYPSDRAGSAGSISVVDSHSGRRIPSATVVLTDGDGARHTASATDPGRWELPADVVWAGSTVSVAAEGYRLNSRELSPEDERHVIIRLVPLTTLRGSVRTIDDSPLTQPLFVVAWVDGRSMEWADLDLENPSTEISITEVDSDGHFTLSPPLVQGSLQLAAVGPGLISESPIPAAEGEQNQLVVSPLFALQLHFRDLSGNGLVVNPLLFRTFNHTTWRAQEPSRPYRCPRALLALTGLTKDPQAEEGRLQGKFSALLGCDCSAENLTSEWLLNLPGYQRREFIAPMPRLRGVLAEAEVSLDQTADCWTDLSIVLVRQSRTDGGEVDASGGSGRGAKVLLLPEDGDPGGQLEFALPSLSSGEYPFEDVPCGRFEVVLETKNRSHRQSLGVMELTRGATELRFDLSSLGRVTFECREHDNNLPRAYLLRTPASKRPNFGVIPEFPFVMDDLAPGRYEVHFGRTIASIASQIRAGEETVSCEFVVEAGKDIVVPIPWRTQ